MSAKLLSIIIPTYNMELYLARCLNSLIVDNADYLSQLEILVVNDGSKDHSLEIATQFSIDYPNVFYVIDKKNGNYGSCINAGLKVASGKYIKVLDSDDCFNTKNFLDFLYFLTQVSVDVVFSDYVHVDPDENIIGEKKFVFNKSNGELGDILNVQPCAVQMHGITYRTELVRAINYFQSEGISYTDQEWDFTPMAYAKTYAYYDKIVYRYYLGRNGQTMDDTVFEKNFWMEIKSAKVMVDSYLNREQELCADGRLYMQNRILWRSGVIAYSYFFIQKTKKNHQLMMEYDNYLKEHVNFLWKQLGDTLKKSGYPYLRKWRVNGYPPRPLLVSLIRFKDSLGFHR